MALQRVVIIQEFIHSIYYDFCVPFIVFVFAVVPSKDPMSIERSNLLSMMKLSIKVLIQSSLSLGRTLDSEYPPLLQFFVVLEHCLKHGLKGETLDQMIQMSNVPVPADSFILLMYFQPRNPLLDRTSPSGDH